MIGENPPFDPSIHEVIPPSLDIQSRRPYHGFELSLGTTASNIWFLIYLLRPDPMS
jgi:hypothetical protein